MSDQDSATAESAATPDERVAIGISFGNSNSSIAHTSGVSGKPNHPSISLIDTPAGGQGRSDCQ